MTAKICGKSQLPSTLTLLLLLTATVLGQQANEDLLGKRLAVFEKTATLHVILQSLAQEYLVPIGFENVPERMSPSAISVKVENRTLREILDEITRVDPRYTWEESNGVVNVLPVNSKETLSLLPVKQFHVEHKNRNEVSQSVTDIPEVQAFLISQRILRYDVDDILPNSPSKLLCFSFTLTNTSMRDILNCVLINSHSHYWVIYRYGEENELVTVNVGL